MMTADLLSRARAADGEAFRELAVPGSIGYDPEKILCPPSPLLASHEARRVALHVCPSGGSVIAPVILLSPDGRRVSWVDFRDAGFFAGPGDLIDAAEGGGPPRDLPDLHFDREQYVAEITRASAYECWETDRRRTSRLLYERLQPLGLVMPRDLSALKELLSELDPGTELEVRMDSQYAMNAVTTWLPRWKANGWQTASKKPSATAWT